MELPNTKGVIFMPKIYLNSNERMFLFDSLSKMEKELRKVNDIQQTPQQEEFLEAISCVYGNRVFNLCGAVFSTGGVISAESLKHPKEIMEICMEYAFLYYAKEKDICMDEFFEKFDFLFDLFPVSRKMYKELLKKTGDRICVEGPNGFVKKYKDMIVDERQADGYFDIEIPEIRIPAHVIEVDVSDKETFENWSTVQDKISDLMSDLVKTKSGCTEEEISAVFSNLIDHVYNQLGNAEEKYEELKNQEDVDEEDEE